MDMLKEQDVLWIIFDSIESTSYYRPLQSKNPQK